MKKFILLSLLSAVSAWADVSTVVSPPTAVDPACVAAVTAAASATSASIVQSCPATYTVTATYTPPIVVPPPLPGVQIKTKVGYCLDAATPAGIVQKACDASKPSQVFDGSVMGRYAQSGRCLGVGSSTNGTQLSMMGCTAAATLWTTPSGNVRNAGVSKCIDIPLSQVLIPGAIAQIWSCDVPTSNEQMLSAVAVGTAPPPPPPPPASGAQTVTFTQSNEDFLNPGQGFYVSPKPSEMNVTQLTNFVNYWKTRLFLYSPDLSPYRNATLPASYLATLNAQLAAARSAGVKLIIWPQYNSDSGGADAPINLALQHIQQLGAVWTKNADIIPFFKAGYIGSYGEWWGSQNGLDSDANKLSIKNAILANTPASSMVYIRTPRDIQKWYPTPAAAAAARIGFHNDCYLANDTDANTFSGLNDSLRSYAKGLTTFGFETCDNVSNPEQMRKTCAQALSENAAYKATWGNKSYAPTFIDSWTVGGCLDKIGRSFGYRYFVSSINYDVATPGGQPTTITARVQNVGNSGLFDDRALIVTLRNQATGALVSGQAGKLRLIAGGASATMSAVLTAPAGTYDILLSAPDPSPSIAGDVRYAVRFANMDVGSARWVAPYYQTGAVLVVTP